MANTRSTMSQFQRHMYVNCPVSQLHMGKYCVYLSMCDSFPLADALEMIPSFRQHNRTEYLESNTEPIWCFEMGPRGFNVP